MNFPALRKFKQQ